MNTNGRLVARYGTYFQRGSYYATPFWIPSTRGISIHIQFRIRVRQWRGKNESNSDVIKGIYHCNEIMWKRLWRPCWNHTQSNMHSTGTGSSPNQTLNQTNLINWRPVKTNLKSQGIVCFSIQYSEQKKFELSVCY